MLPSIMFYAALNAFAEEMTYRAPMLAASNLRSAAPKPSG